MDAANLHTLDGDILYELLATCCDLVSLRCLILTHPALYHAFNHRRRLILRTVFTTQNHVRPSHRPSEREVSVAHQYILRITPTSSTMDRVALREALWPGAKRTCQYAIDLLSCYHQAGLKEEALLFARDTIRIVLATSQPLRSEQRTLAKCVIRTYTAAKLPQEAMDVGEKVLQRLDPRSPEHTIWAKQLINTYRNRGQDEKVLLLQLDCWKLCRKLAGPGSHVALEWARSIIRDYELKGEHGKAIEFHRRVRGHLDPTTAQYVAWSRQLIQMHQRCNQHGEALVVMEEVWHHLRPDTTGYRAWARQLSEVYYALGRREDGLIIMEAVWTGIAAHSARFPNDMGWRYKARGAALMLAKSYRRHERTGDANALEAKCGVLGLPPIDIDWGAERLQA